MIDASREQRNLALGGCGSALACHVGALDRWSQQYTFSRLIGTSGGAIIVMFLAMGWNADQIFKFLLSHPPISLLDRHLSGWRSMGWWSGNKLLEVLTKICPYTFEEFVACDLTVVVGNYSKHRAEYCSPQLTPKMLVAEAVRRSLSIPFMFGARKDPVTGDFYIDGGVYNNFAVDYWGNKEPIHGFRIVGAHNKPIAFVPTSEFLSTPKNLGIFTANLLNDLMALNEHTHIAATHWENVCTINTDVNGLDLNQKEVSMDRMFQQGFVACSEFLEAKEKEKRISPLLL